MVLGVVLGGVALVAGSVGYYHYRRFRSCTVELEGAVQSAKTFEAFLHDSRPDGLYRRVERQQAREVRQLVSAWSHGAEQSADLEAKASRAKASAVFLFGDTVYVLFFDERDRLREFACLGN